MMEVLGTPSPGPSTVIHTPPAPQHGYEDSWEPFSPRKSARLSKRVAHRTPSPPPTLSRKAQQQQQQPQDQQQHRQFPSSPKTTSRRATAMATPLFSPRKKAAPATQSAQRASAALATETAAAAASFLAPPGRSDGGMLITPAKTPQKPPTEHNKAKIKSIARSLFHEPEVMPSPKKTRAARYTLDSFTMDEDADAPIEIFTDSHERIPEVDNSAANPFYGDHQEPPAEPTRRRSKRHLINIPGEGQVTLEEAVRRDDGMLIVFRGKKQFRKFSDMEDQDFEDGEGGLAGAVESRSRRPLTRSSVKPRLLFPTKPEPPVVQSQEDEEADTDIEDHVLERIEEKSTETPVELVEEAPGTPKAPKFAPASPPTTARTTRFKKPTEAPASKPKEASKRSPFDGWRRTKGASDGHGSKRPGGPLIGGPSAKRTRAD